MMKAGEGGSNECRTALLSRPDGSGEPSYETRPSRQVREARPARIWPGLALCVLIGCAAQNQHLEHALMTERAPTAHRDHMTEPYRIGCPDEIAIIVAGRSRLNGRYMVGPNGRINLGELGRLRMEGKTTAEAGVLIAERAGVPSAAVQVAVQTFRSQQVYLVGEIRGLQRSVPYQGPERVVELLQRVGGLTPGAAAADVYLIRSHLIDGGPPEVFQVDLQAILTKHDERTNIVVQPFDQITVGETRQSNFARSLPPLLLPLYQSLLGLQQRPAS